MLLCIEGIAGSGKSTLRDRLLTEAARRGMPLGHLGQFSWLNPAATRLIVAMRQGQRPSRPAAALSAVHADLALHARHNITTANLAGHVLADRHMLATACLLALLYGGDLDTYLTTLAAIPAARPQITVLLTTPTGLCEQRLRQRVTSPRFGEQPHQAQQLADLYQHAADVWSAAFPETVLLRHTCVTPGDLDYLTEACLHQLAQAESRV